MDRSYGSDDWLAEQEDHRRNEALDRWHATHEHPHEWADECSDCATDIDNETEETE